MAGTTLSTARLLLDLVRPDSAARYAAASQALGHGIDWDALLDLAYEEGLAPLVYATLRQVPCQHRNGSPLSRFQFTYRLAGNKNATAYSQLAPVLEEFAARGLDPIVLKGAGFAGLAYRDIALRPFSDIDVLVKTSEVDRAHDTLTSLGYQFNYKGNPIARPSQVDRKFRDGRQYFCARRGALSIDLYWRLDRYPYQVSLDYQGLWERARPVTLAGASAKVLSPEDALVHLALEFVQDVWSGQPRLMTVRDIAQITDAYEVDWDALLLNHKDPALSVPLYYSLSLARAMVGASVPEEVLRRVYPRQGRWQARLADRLERYVLSRQRPVRYALVLVAMRAIGPEGFSDKLRWLSRLVFPPRSLWRSIPSSVGRLLGSPGDRR